MLESVMVDLPFLGTSWPLLVLQGPHHKPSLLLPFPVHWGAQLPMVLTCFMPPAKSPVLSSCFTHSLLEYRNVRWMVFFHFYGSTEDFSLFYFIMSSYPFAFHQDPYKECHPHRTFGSVILESQIILIKHILPSDLKKRKGKKTQTLKKVDEFILLILP